MQKKKYRIRRHSLIDILDENDILLETRCLEKDIYLYDEAIPHKIDISREHNEQQSN